MTSTQKAEKMEAAAEYHRNAGNEAAAAQATRIAAKHRKAANK